jgi:hypothetical protein
MTPEDLPSEPSRESQSEATAIEGENYDKEEKKRQNRASSHRHAGLLCAWWVFVGLATTIAACWTWNLVASSRFQFWSDSQRIGVQNVLIAILGSTVVNKLSIRWLGN